MLLANNVNKRIILLIRCLYYQRLSYFQVVCAKYLVFSQTFCSIRTSFTIIVFIFYYLSVKNNLIQVKNKLFSGNSGFVISISELVVGSGEQDLQKYFFFQVVCVIECLHKERGLLFLVKKQSDWFENSSKCMNLFFLWKHLMSKSFLIY